ncbi:hypothetical protein [Spongiactinospora sp. TRM90649]|uniref:hypothetical protein n=1 Tax=Spongiactinospora sp. TRM90649 TaxID=3031114 RepID=UPI0023F6633E|nr:hypothetical protein [Spongiactinospora sp. TRM90649]MDF5756059.1 hypothetical protein [Spongiactinospora sp. TRM90649]
MRRTTRNLLGLAAVTATALAIALPATTSASAAVTAAPASATTATSSFDDFWGYYYSKRYDGDSRAKARGRVWTGGDDRVHVSGKLYDKGSPWWLCGYVQVKFENADGDEWIRWARKCGSSGYTSFHFAGEDVDNAAVRVCYWNTKQHAKKYCGRWDYVYEADEHEDDEV